MNSLHSRVGILGAALALVKTATSASTCLTYGIDFQNDQHYFINQASTDNFTSVFQFEGCSGGYSDVLLVDPERNQYICSEIPTTPDDVSQMSTCPITKSQMYSGEWLLILEGNNGDAEPFNAELDLYLTVGEQVTSTVTSTMTWDITSTPIITTTLPSTVVVTETVDNTETVTLPSATAKKTHTIHPSPITSWVSDVFTRTKQSWTKTLTTVTETETLSCTIPPRPSQHNPPATYIPTGITIAVYQTPAAVRRNLDKPVNARNVRRMLREARRERGISIPARLEDRELDERSPDSATVYVTAAAVVNTTVTHTAAATTTTEYQITTDTTSTTLSPSTVYSGKTAVTVTAPTPTKTRTSISYTTITAVKTLYKTWTYTTMVTPTASVSACAAKGGHYRH